MRSWKDCFPPQAQKKFDDAKEKSARHYRDALSKEKQTPIKERSKPLTQQQIFNRCRSRVNVRWSIFEQHPTVQNVHRAGLILDTPPGRIPTIHVSKPINNEHWGYGAAAKDALKIGYKDRHLVSFFKWGVQDFSKDTPPMCTFFGSHPQALHRASVFTEQLEGRLQKDGYPNHCHILARCRSSSGQETWC